MAALEFLNFDGCTGKENSIYNFKDSQLVIFVVNTWQLWFLNLFDWMCLKCCKLNKLQGTFRKKVLFHDGLAKRLSSVH